MFSTVMLNIVSTYTKNKMRWQPVVLVHDCCNTAGYDGTKIRYVSRDQICALCFAVLKASKMSIYP